MNSVSPPDPQDEAPSNAPYHKGNVPARLMAAAERILETEPVEQITARRLCREVGVTSANFYNHYPSLDFLLLEIASKGFEARTRMMRKLMKRNLPREEAMVQCAIQTVELSLKRPQLFRIMFGYVKDPSTNKNYTTRADISLATLTQMVYGEDIFRADDILWSHENCKKAYAFFSFIYGVAVAISTGMISNPVGTHKGQMQFVEDLTRTFIKDMA